MLLVLNQAVLQRQPVDAQRGDMRPHPPPPKLVPEAVHHP
jgi:hypothetical protein